MNKMGALGAKENELLGGKVVAGSVDESAMTCSVDIMLMDEPVEGVLLNVTESNVKGLVPIPEDNSNVWLGWIDGELCVLKCAKVKKVLVDVPQVLVTCNDVQFNGGKNGGLIKIEDLVSKMNRLEDKVNDLVTKHNALETSYNGHTHIYSPGPSLPIPTATPLPLSTNSETPIAPKTQKTDLENTKIKH